MKGRKIHNFIANRPKTKKRPGKRPKAKTESLVKFSAALKKVHSRTQAFFCRVSNKRKMTKTLCTVRLRNGARPHLKLPNRGPWDFVSPNGVRQFCVHKTYSVRMIPSKCFLQKHVVTFSPSNNLAHAFWSRKFEKFNKNNVWPKNWRRPFEGPRLTGQKCRWHWRINDIHGNCLSWASQWSVVLKLLLQIVWILKLNLLCALLICSNH